MKQSIVALDRQKGVATAQETYHDSKAECQTAQHNTVIAVLLGYDEMEAEGEGLRTKKKGGSAVADPPFLTRGW
jgi:hypothetical protein